METGFLFLNGAYLAPPYRIEASGTKLLINGQTARDITRTAPPAPAAPPATAANLDDLLAIGAARLRDLGLPNRLPTDDQLAALAVELERALPGSAVRVDSGFILLTAVDGSEERLHYWVRPPDPKGDNGEGLMASTAAAWSSLLNGGGTLILAGMASLAVSPSEAPEFIADLASALDGTAGPDGLDLLLGSPALTASLRGQSVPDSLRSRIPPKANARRPANRADDMAPVSARIPMALEGTASQGRLGHYRSRTPSSNRAYAMMPVLAEWFQSCGVEPLREAASRQSYRMYEFWSKAATIEEFAAASGHAGIYYACQHGNNAFGPYESKAAANAEVARLRARGITGVWAGDVDGTWYVAGAQAFLTAHWRDAGTIVIADMCAGAHLAKAWGAREFIGTFENVSAADIGQPLVEFWGRMDGTLDNGDNRAVVDAFRESFPQPFFVHSGYGEGRTVLTPAVVKVNPPPGSIVPAFATITVRVQFDARMNPIMTPHQIMKFGGTCNPRFELGASFDSGTWVDGDYAMEFRVTTGPPGSLTSIVKSPFASSGDDLGLALDGNQEPDGTDHVGPNYDPYVFDYVCAVPLPTTGLPPPTSVPTAPPTPAASATPTPTAPTTPSPAPTPSPALTPTPTPSPTPTPTPTPSPKATPTPSPSIPIVSGIYNGALATVGANPHKCCINPTGENVTIIRRRVLATGELFVEIRNLVGAAGPAVILKCGPYGPPDDAAIVAYGIGTVAGFKNVLVTFEGRLTAVGGLVGTLTVGPGNLPGLKAAVFAISLRKTAPLP